MWDAQDREIIIDMHVKPVEPEPETAEDFRSWMNAHISLSWGRTTLIIVGIVTALSIISMVIKHI
jgi:hypothetical protein